MAKTGSQDMAVSSGSSAKSAGRSTRSTVKLTPGQALEILQQSLLECQAAGVRVQIMPDLYDNGQHYVAILVANAEIISGSIRPAGGKNE